MNSYNYDFVNLMFFEEEMKKFWNLIGDLEKKYIYMYLKIFLFILILCIVIWLGE